MRRGSFLNTIFGGGTASAHPPPAPSSSAIATTASHQHAGTAEPAARPPSVPVAVASPTARRRAASHSDLMARHPLIAAAPSGAGRPASGEAEGRRCAARRQGGQTEQKRQKKHSKKTRPRSLSSGSACTRDGVRTSGALLAADSTAISTAVYAWGRGDGQLGDGRVSGTLMTPCCVEDLRGKHVVSLACGSKHTIALTESGDVYIWGWNFNGQLGYDYKDEFRPRLLKPLLLVKALQKKRVLSVAATAISSAALTHTGEMYTWGGNTDHQLGHGDTTNQATLRLVLSLHNYRVTKVSCGGGHVLALTSSGSLFSWGRNYNGRLGHGHCHPVSTPEKVKSLQGVFITKIACGWSHSLCYSDRENGRLWAWGVGKDGRLGLGDTNDRLIPVEVGALRGTLLAHISGGYYHSAAVTATGQTFTWGWGEHGQLGHGTYDTELEPREVEALGQIKMCVLECGGFHSVGYDDRGRCWVFGLGDHGQLGILEEKKEEHTEGCLITEDQALAAPQKCNLPAVVSALRGKAVIFVAAGLWHSMAIVIEGTNTIQPPVSFCQTQVHFLDSQLSPQASAHMNSTSFGCLPYQGEDEQSSTFDVPSSDEDSDSDEGYEDSQALVADDQDTIDDGSHVMSPSPSDQSIIDKLATWIIPTNHTEQVVKEKQMEVQAQHWEENILAHWPRMKNNPRVFSLWKKGIPPSVRGKVWPKAIPNFLALTPNQYSYLREASQVARAQRIEARKRARMEEQPGQIELDLPRTFPKLALFHEEGPFYRQLWDILETYSIFRPEIGYVQGMSFLAAMFLLYMDEFTSFRCLANMLEFPFFRALYKMDIAHILRFVKIYELLFSQQLPELYKEFTEKSISPEHYLLDWFFTLFSRALPFDIVGRLWDRYLLEGEVFLFRSALAILKILLPQLKGKSFEDICLLLRQLPQDIHEGMLFEAIHTIAVPGYCKRLIQRLRSEEERGLEIQMESMDLDLEDDQAQSAVHEQPDNEETAMEK